MRSTLFAQARALSRRTLPPSLLVVRAPHPLLHAPCITSLLRCRAQTESASAHLTRLHEAQPDAAGVKLGITNDWGSHTGFSFTLAFVKEAELDASDERLPLAEGGVVFVDRKALWAGEGGLLGATIDLDEEGALRVTPKEPTG